MKPEPNKEYWQGEEVTGYERKQSLWVPRKDEILDTIIEYIPVSEDEHIHIVDIGAGKAALSRRVLDHFKQAHVTLFESSSEMLEAAKQELSDHAHRISTVVGDFNDENWHESLEKPVNAFVSSIALHFLRTERRQPFFQGVFDLLSKPGCFLEGAGFFSEDPYIQQRCLYRTYEHTQQHLLETEGKKVPIEKIKEEMDASWEKSGADIPLLHDRLEILKQAGFSHVEVVWRYLNLGVIAAYKR